MHFRIKSVQAVSSTLAIAAAANSVMSPFHLDTSTTLWISTDLLGLLLVTYVLYYTFDWCFRKHMPPGPKGLPIIGNRHQLPPSKPWIAFSELNRLYGAF